LALGLSLAVSGCSRLRAARFRAAPKLPFSTFQRGRPARAPRWKVEKGNFWRCAETCCALRSAYI